MHLPQLPGRAPDGRVKLEAWDKAPAWPMAWVGLTDVALDCFRAAIGLYFFKASFA